VIIIIKEKLKINDDNENVVNSRSDQIIKTIINQTAAIFFNFFSFIELIMFFLKQNLLVFA
jgi:hypothetical protein